MITNDAFSIYHLEDNYRSEASIVKASAQFISRNRDRIAKRIRSKSKRQAISSKAYAYRLVGAQDEARFIAETIENLVTNENYDYSDNKFHIDYCVICLEKFKEKENLIKLNCFHIFHKNCLDIWLEKNKKCPICKNEFVISFNINYTI